MWIDDIKVQGHDWKIRRIFKRVLKIDRLKWSMSTFCNRRRQLTMMMMIMTRMMTLMI